MCHVVRIDAFSFRDELNTSVRIQAPDKNIKDFSPHPSYV
jgi:hypothetical protein